MSHLAALTIFSVIVSLVFSLLTKEDNGERFKYFLKLFATFFCLSILAAWVMYLFPF